MSVICSRPPDERSRATCRDVIERFLERSWLLERLPLQSLNGHRFALILLDNWMQKHRVVTLAGASAADLRAAFQSPNWDEMSRRCESLLGLVTRFYNSLRECRFRADDPIETLIEQELTAAARARQGKRARRVERSRQLVFARTPAA